MTSQAGAPGSGAGQSHLAVALSLAERRRIVFGLLLAIFLAAMDQTILAISLVTIARELHGLDLMPWLVSGYLVAATVSTPIYGKLSDLYGRRPLLLAAISIYMLAGILAMLAQSAPQLLVLRILQGLGAGGLLSLAHATIADIAPGVERGRYQGMISGVFAFAAVAGPVFGGYLTHYISWRAVFAFTVLIAAAALLSVRRALRRLPVGRGRAGRPIDYAGALLLGGGLATLMIALTRFGQGRGGDSASTLGLLAASAVLFVACAWRERRAPEPIMPPELFRNRTMVMCCALLALMFFVLVGMTVLLPIAMQTVGGADTDQVALRMLPLTLSIPFGAFLAGRLMLSAATPRTLMIGGAALTLITLIAIALTGYDSRLAMGAWMLLLGVGIGVPLPAALVALQMAVAARQIGIATATSALFRTLGGAIGIAILTSVLFEQLRAGAIPGSSPAASALLGSVAQAGAEATYAAFRAAYGVAALAALAALGCALAMPSAVGPPGIRRRSGTPT
ncbi:MAG: MFS transporter [Burkholderiaceae bacterium]|nr:MFS transporter [Burkholderiaceae bacterium]